MQEVPVSMTPTSPRTRPGASGLPRSGGHRGKAVGKVEFMALIGCLCARGGANGGGRNRERKAAGVNFRSLWLAALGRRLAPWSPVGFAVRDAGPEAKGGLGGRATRTAGAKWKSPAFVLPIPRLRSLVGAVSARVLGMQMRPALKHPLSSGKDTYPPP